MIANVKGLDYARHRWDLSKEVLKPALNQGIRVWPLTSFCSDIDILAKLDSGRSLLDIVAIKQDLEDLIGCDVDVVTEAAISLHIRGEVLGEAVSL